MRRAREIARARRIADEALAANPELTAEYIGQSELYRDPEVERLLIERLTNAGVPRQGQLTEVAAGVEDIA